MNEWNLPIASGVNRGWSDESHVVTLAPVIIVRESVIVADKYGHIVL